MLSKNMFKINLPLDFNLPRVKMLKFRPLPKWHFLLTNLFFCTFLIKLAVLTFRFNHKSIFKIFQTTSNPNEMNKKFVFFRNSYPFIKNKPFLRYYRRLSELRCSYRTAWFWWRLRRSKHMETSRDIYSIVSVKIWSYHTKMRDRDERVGHTCPDFGSG